MGFSYMDHPDGLNKTLFSPGFVLEMAPTVNTVGRMYIPRAGQGEEPLVVLMLLQGHLEVTSS